MRIKDFIYISFGLIVSLAISCNKPELPITDEPEKTPQEPMKDFYSMIVDPVQKIYGGFEPKAFTGPFEVARGETAIIQVNIGSRTLSLGEVTPELVSFARKGNSGIEIRPTMSWLKEITASGKWWNTSMKPSDEELSPDMKYPDPILPINEHKVFLEPGTRAQLWMEFDIPRSCSPGLYEGVVKFSASGQEILQDFSVKVYPVTLPRQQEMIVCQWENGPADAMNGGNPVTPERALELQGELVRTVTKYGQNAFRLTCNLNPNLYPWAVWDEEVNDFVFKFDFGSMIDKEFENIISNCPDVRQIHGPAFLAVDNRNGYFPELGRPSLVCGYRYFKTDSNGEYIIDHTTGTPVIEWVGASSRKGIDTNPLVRKYFANFFRELGKYLKSKVLPDGRTWLDLYVQNICDEPHSSWSTTWNEYAKMVKEGCPEMKCFDPTNVKLDPAVCDFPCPLLDKMNSITAEGSQTQWMYTSIFPQGKYANRLIRMPLIKTRILHWINFKYNAPGYLHWGLRYWVETTDCFGDVGTGDNFIVYPGNGKVYPSIRLCAMRDGIRDYELLCMVREKSRERAMDFVSEIVIDYENYNTDPTHFRNVRHHILEYLSGQ